MNKRKREILEEFERKLDGAKVGTRIYAPAWLKRALDEYVDRIVEQVIPEKESQDYRMTDSGDEPIPGAGWNACREKILKNYEQLKDK